MKNISEGARELASFRYSGKQVKGKGKRDVKKSIHLTWRKVRVDWWYRLVVSQILLGFVQREQFMVSNRCELKILPRM